MSFKNILNIFKGNIKKGKMKKDKKIIIDNLEVQIINSGDQDYISITDLVKNRVDGLKLIEKWLTNKSTIDYLGAWESLHNSNFNSHEFGGIRTEAGSNNFTMSVKKWTRITNAIGITAKSGRYGGTFAHSDIAIQFCMWVDPLLNIIVIKEFQKFKKEEQNRLNGNWDIGRFLSKTNYIIHTDAIKKFILPTLNKEDENQWLIYAEEADILNVALFGITAKEWKSQNINKIDKNSNIRDYADLYQLIILSNLESINAKLISDGLGKYQRLVELRKAAIFQLESLKTSTKKLDNYKNSKLNNSIIVNDKLNDKNI